MSINFGNYPIVTPTTIVVECIIMGKSGSIGLSIFSILNEMVYTLDVAFSRDSLSRKLMRMDIGYRACEVNQSFRRLEKSGFIKRSSKNGEEYKLTPKGHLRIDYLKYDTLSFNPKGKPWDKLWRIIVFDIPEKKRNARDLLRRKIKEWECTKLQNSVFITPYPCDGELDELIQILDVQAYVHVMVVPTLGEKLTSTFMKKYDLKK